MTNCNASLTPLEQKVNIEKKIYGEKVNSTTYRWLLEWLRYLTHTRPHLIFSVGYISILMESQTPNTLKLRKESLDTDNMKFIHEFT